MPRKEVIFPIVLIDDYPFIVGRIAGVGGKLMLDTGYAHALTINEHRVPRGEALTVGKGHFGSGQTSSAEIAHFDALIAAGASRCGPPPTGRTRDMSIHVQPAARRGRAVSV